MTSFEHYDGRDLYFPYQPLFKNLNGYFEIRNGGRLNHGIALFYKFRTDENIEPVFVVPDGCIDIIFSCNPDNPTAYICGSVIKGTKVWFQSASEFFGVRFFPGYAANFLKHPLKEFTEKEIPLTEVIGKSWSIVESIASQNDFDFQIEIFKNFLNHFLFFNEKNPEIVKYFMFIIIKNHGVDKIDQLAKMTGYSTRYINKVFEKHIGISPKLFSRVVRFQKSLELLLYKDITRMNDIIFELEYYDQSHFIKEFKEFCFFAPNQLKMNLKPESNVPKLA